MSNGTGVAAKFLAQKFGVGFTVRETLVSVGQSAVVAAPNDPDRISVLFINTGATAITLSLREGLVAGNGILLLDNGSTLGANVDEDGIIPSWTWNAISDLAGGELHVVEIIGESRP